MLTSRIEKIAKKLSVFTIDDISVILEEPEKNIKNAIQDLEDKNLLKNNGSNIIYIEPERPKPIRIRERTRSRKVCNVNYNNYEQNFISQTISLFCADVETSKTALLLNFNQKAIIGIYGDFRKKIYEKQLKELEDKFFNLPKLPSSREYLKTNVYLYGYGKHVFLSLEALQTEQQAKIHAKKEVSQIKLINCLLRRRFEKSSNFNYVEHRAAEYIWRRNKKFKELVKDIETLVKEQLQEEK